MEEGMTSPLARRYAGYLLTGFTDLMRGTRYDVACTECHCEDCLPLMPKRGCCGLGRALRDAANLFTRKPGSSSRTAARRKAP